jgi:putative ABC transport system permease protein
MRTLTMALRNIARQRARSAVTLAAIVSGVAAIILAGGWINDIFVQLAEALIHSQSGHLQISKTGYFAAGSQQPEKFLMPHANEIADKLRQQAGVQSTTTRLNFSALLNNGRSDLAVIGQGVEPDKEAKLGSYIRISAGHRMTGAEPFGMMIGNGVAQALNLVPGARVTLLANTVDGGLNTLDFEIVGIFDSFSKDYDARAVQIAIGAAQELLGTHSANTIVVTLQRTDDTQAIAQAFRNTLASEGLELVTWLEMNDFYTKTVALYQSQFAFLQIIILMMILLSVANSTNMSIYERVGEFGTMRALGNRGAKVFRLIIVEAFVLGLIGAGLGCALGVLLAWAISAVGITMPPPPNADLGYIAYVRIVPSIVAAAFLLGLCATVLASILPARRVARMAVVEALRQNV